MIIPPYNWGKNISATRGNERTGGKVQESCSRPESKKSSCYAEKTASPGGQKGGRGTACAAWPKKEETMRGSLSQSGEK